MNKMKMIRAKILEYMKNNDYFDIDKCFENCAAPNICKRIFLQTRVGYMKHDIKLYCTTCGFVKKISTEHVRLDVVKIVMYYCDKCSPNANPTAGTNSIQLLYDKEENRIYR